jgi:hypothetical protein
MRRLSTFLVLVLVCCSVHGWAAERSLVYVQVSADRGPTLTAAGVELAAEVPDGYLAFLPPEALSRLVALQVTHVVIAPDDPQTDVYVRWAPGAGDRIEPLLDEMEVIHRDRDFAVMRLPRDEDRLLPPLHDTRFVFRHPLHFVTTPWEGPAPGQLRTADPSIQAMVETITDEWLLDHVQTLEDFGSRHSQHANGEAASFWLRDQFLSYGYLDVTLHSYNNWNDNVVCIRLGTVTPQKWVVVGGHYDSIGYWWQPGVAPGADDNATGTVGVLAAARAMAPYQFEYSVAYLAFSGEEQGLHGSTAWANLAAATGMDLEGALIMDMLGYRHSSSPINIDIIFNPASEPLRDLIDDVVTLYVPGHAAVDGYLPPGAASDHVSFWNAGYRSILFFESSQAYSPYIHSPQDLIGPSVNDIPFMNLNVRTAVAATAAMARPLSGSTSVGQAPAAVAQLQAYPNPFNPQTALSFALPRAGHAVVSVYDAQGRLVARPLANHTPAGTGLVHWNAEGQASGLYLVRLELDGEVLKTTKLTLVR